MKNLKTKIMLAFAAFAVGFGFCVAPVTYTAFAEETQVEEIVETPEESTETAPKTDEETEIVETPTTEENGKNTLDFSALSYEDFLAFVGELAEKTGNADEWNDTVEAVRKAIDEKQFTLATVGNFLLMAVMLVKIVADAIAKRKEKKHVDTTEKQTAKINEQTVAINSNTTAINEQSVAVAKVEEDERKTHAAIKHLSGMVLTLAERFDIGAASKEAIRLEANEINKTLGE